MPAFATAMSKIEIAAEGTRRMPSGPGRTPPLSSPDRDSVPRIGTARVCGTAAGIAPRLIHSLTPKPRGELGHVPLELAPAVVGLGAGEHEEVALADPGRADDELGPDEAARAAVDDLEGRAPGAVVEDRVRVEGRDHPAALGEMAGRDGGGAPGIDPAVERDDDRGRVEIGQLPAELEQAHGRGVGECGFSLTRPRATSGPALGRPRPCPPSRSESG